MKLCNNENVCGCSYNAALTLGSICLEGNTKHIKQLSTNFIEKNKDLLLLATPFINLIRPLNGVLNLSYAEPNSSPTELSRFMT